MRGRRMSIRFDGAPPPPPTPIRAKAELTAAEAGKLLGISEETLRKRVRDGIYPFAVSSGHRVLIFRPELERWLGQGEPLEDDVDRAVRNLDEAIDHANELLRILKEIAERRRARRAAYR